MRVIPQKRVFVWLAVVLLTGAVVGGCAGSQPPTGETPALSVTASNTSTLVPAADLQSETPAPIYTDTPVIRLNTPTAPESAFTWTPVTTFTATPHPSRTQTPTDGPTPRFTRTATRTPTVTQTPGPPDALLRITRPGLYSKITSPYKMEAMVTPGEDGYVYLSLLGEDGRLLYAQSLDYRRSLYSRFLIVPSIEFDLTGVAETARLSLETHDAFGRRIAVSSVEVVLLSIGDNETNAVERVFSPYVIDAPFGGQTVSGGELVISGRAAPVSSAPLQIELWGENGEVLAARTLALEPPEGQTYAAFTVELAYAVPGQTQARLAFYQESDGRIPGVAALNSVAIQLRP